MTPSDILNRLHRLHVMQSSAQEFLKAWEGEKDDKEVTVTMRFLRTLMSQNLELYEAWQEADKERGLLKMLHPSSSHPQ
jgi:hypothetical protein